MMDNLGRYLAALTVVLCSQEGVAQTALPPDADQRCTVSNFASWFQSGQVGANGSVIPPNSLAFPNARDCDFYTWAERMFLWLTSPPPAEYGPGSYVFDTPVFYEVSPPDAQKRRTLTANSPDRIKNVSVSISQAGPQGDAVVFDSLGKIHTLVRPERDAKSGHPFIRDQDGKTIEIARTKIDLAGRPIFLDKSGKPIDFKRNPDGTPLLFDLSGSTIKFASPFKTITIHGQPFFLDRSGNLIETVRGAASQPVLMAQGNKLVYYTIAVNDVYAYFLTGTQENAIAANNFPINADDLHKVENFANMMFPDTNVLAVEVKFAWIEAVGIADISSYVTTWANIPTYDTSDDSHWVPNGSKKAQLVLVGMNVAFGVKSHKEMLWAAFEHINNTPNPKYDYVNMKRKTVSSPPSTGGNWLFSSSGAGAPNQNVRRMYLNGDDIYADQRFQTIGPSNILRLKPWGLEPNNASANTNVIAINNSILAGLGGGDVRKNYILIGTTWSSSGGSGGTPLGTNELANSTMETFFQGSNCLDCHRGSNTSQPGSVPSMLGTPNGGGVSHIYGVTNRLPFP